MNISATDRENPSESFGIRSVAAWLKAVREERGETLDEVAKVTRIGKNYLAAIEGGDLSKLPSQAYTRGFIRLYASHLGLSPEKALAMMDTSQTGPVAVNTDLQSTPQRPERSLPSYIRNLILITSLITALASAYFLLKQPKPGSSPAQSSRIDAPPADKAVTLPDTTQQQSYPKSESVPPLATQQETGEDQGIVLRLKAVSNGKIHITIDDSVSQDYELVTGDLVEWKAEDTIRLDLDNAASVEGELDGAKLPTFGEEGKAAHLVVKSDGIHKE